MPKDKRRMEAKGGKGLEKRQIEDEDANKIFFFYIADKREFIQISKAVGVGFLVMGAIGYLIKLSMISP